MPQIFEAEDATIVGAEIKDFRPTASGAFVDYANASGDYIDWSWDVTRAGARDVSFSYALGSSSPRPLQL